MKETFPCFFSAFQRQIYNDIFTLAFSLPAFMAGIILLQPQAIAKHVSSKKNCAPIPEYRAPIIMIFVQNLERNSQIG